MSIQEERPQFTLSSSGSPSGLSPFWALLVSASSSPSRGRAAFEKDNFPDATLESLAIRAIEALEARNQALFESVQSRPEDWIDYQAVCVSPAWLHPPGWVEEEIGTAVASGTINDTRRPPPISGYDGNRPLVNHPPTYPPLPPRPKPKPKPKQESKSKRESQTAAQPEPRGPQPISAGRNPGGSQRHSVDRRAQDFAADGGLCRSDAGKKKSPPPPLPPRPSKPRYSSPAPQGGAGERKSLSPVLTTRGSPPTRTAGPVQQPGTTSPTTTTTTASPWPPSRCGAHQASYASVLISQHRVGVSDSQGHWAHQLLTPSSTPRETAANGPKLALFPPPAIRGFPLEKTAPPPQGPAIPQPCRFQIPSQPLAPPGQAGLERVRQRYSGDGAVCEPKGNPRQGSVPSLGDGAPRQSLDLLHHLHYRHHCRSNQNQHHRQVAVGSPGRDLPPKIPVAQEVGVPAKPVVGQLQDQVLCQEVQYHLYMGQYHQQQQH